MQGGRKQRASQHSADRYGPPGEQVCIRSVPRKDGRKKDRTQSRLTLSHKVDIVSSERGRRDRKPWAPNAQLTIGLDAQNITRRGMRGGLEGTVPLPTAVGLAG